jgi:hypothetical protein
MPSDQEYLLFLPEQVETACRLLTTGKDGLEKVVVDLFQKLFPRNLPYYFFPP